MSIAGIMERIGEGVDMARVNIGCAAKRVEIGISNMKAERKIRAAQKPSSLSEEEEAESDAILEKNMREYKERIIARQVAREAAREWTAADYERRLRNYEKAEE